MKATSTVLSIAGYLALLGAVVLFALAGWEHVLLPAQAGEVVAFPSDLTAFVRAAVVFAVGALTFATGRALSAVADARPRVTIVQRSDGFYVVSKHSEAGPFATGDIAQLALERPILTETLTHRG